MVKFPRSDVTLTVYNVDTKISGPYPRLAVKDILSYYQAGYEHSKKYQFGIWDGKVCLLKRDIFPTGLLDLVEGVLIEEGVSYSIQDYRSAPEVEVPTILDVPVELREYQEQIVRDVIEAKRGIIWVGTGGGKTEIAASVIKTLGLSTLFMVHRSNLLKQTKTRFEKFFGKKIGAIGSGSWDIQDVTVGMVQTLYARLRNPKTKKQAFDYLKSVDVLVIDECHLASATTWVEVSKHCMAGYRYGLSGTPSTDGKGLWLAGITGPIIATKLTKDLVEEGHLAKPIIYMVSHPFKTIKKKTPWKEVYEKGIVEDNDRNRLIAKVASSNAKEGPTLVLFFRKDHGLAIAEQLKSLGFHKYHLLDGDDSIDARMDAIADLNSGKVDLLVTSTIFDEGMDIPELRTVVLAGGGKSWEKTLQRIGRGLRKSATKDTAKIYDFVDTSHRYLAEHTLTRMRYYRNEEFEIRKATVD